MSFGLYAIGFAISGVGILSRLRKKGRCDLDSLQSAGLCDVGKDFGGIRWCPADSLSGLQTHCNLGLPCLHRQIPHTD